MTFTEQTELNYELIDSGAGNKLERFGSIVLARPSSIAIWKKLQSENIWRGANARLLDERWDTELKPEHAWQARVADITLELRLQNNGQVGFFPEHAGYLAELGDALNRLQAGRKRALRMLNLFAYTGLASVFAAKRGVEVTHVDLSKKALTWAKRNFELNQIPDSQVRLVCDDAVKYLEREVKRQRKYDVVILDPPSFSRTSKNQFWKLEDVLPTLAELGGQALEADNFCLVFTCHHPGVTCEMLANVLRQSISSKNAVISRCELGVKEAQSERILSAGSYACASALK